MKTVRHILAGVLLACLPLAAQTSPYPSALDTNSSLKVAVNGVSTLLTVTANSSQLTFTISACAGITAYVLIVIDSEIMPVTGCSGTVLSVGSRGFDGTPAAAHTAPVSIYAYVVAWNVNAANQSIIAVETALGTNLSNVVLPNSSPSFTNLTATGTLSVSGNASLGGTLAVTGNVTSGTWHGSVIGATYGGTGVNNGSNTLTLAGPLITTGAYTPTLAFPATGTWTFPAVGTLIGNADTATVTNTMLFGGIAASKLIGTDIATVGTITSGTWHGTVIGSTYGGTGVNNGSATLTLGGNVTFSGAFNPTFVIPASSSWTFPAAGTIVGSADTGTVTNTMLAGSITNAKLVAPVTVTNCGTSASCAAPAALTNYKVMMMTPTFSASATLSVTGISPAFTAANDYACQVTDGSHPAYTFGVNNTSGSAFTITASSSNSDQVQVMCGGF